MDRAVRIHNHPGVEEGCWCPSEEISDVRALHLLPPANNGVVHLGEIALECFKLLTFPWNVVAGQKVESPVSEFQQMVEVFRRPVRGGWCNRLRQHDPLHSCEPRRETQDMVVRIRDFVGYCSSVSSVVFWLSIHRDGEDDLWIFLQIIEPCIIQSEAVGGKIHPSNRGVVSSLFERGTDNIRNQERLTTKYLDRSSTLQCTEQAYGFRSILRGQRWPPVFRGRAIATAKIALTGDGKDELFHHCP